MNIYKSKKIYDRSNGQIPALHFYKRNRINIGLKFIIPYFFIVIFSINIAFADTHSRMADNPANFSLSFLYSNVDLKTNNTIINVNQRRISASIFNTINPYLDIGLVLGSSYLGIDNDSLTEGIDLNGNHIGFLVQGAVGNNTQVGYRAYYLYQDAKGTNTLRSATITWVEWLTEASLRLNIGSSWTLNLGGGLLGIEARRHVNGDINDSQTLKNNADFQGHLSISLHTRPDGKITMNIFRGAQSGSMLTFSRNY